MMKTTASLLMAALVACASGTSRKEPREDRPDDAVAGDAATGDPGQAGDNSGGDPGGGDDASAGDAWSGPRPEDGWVPPTPTRSLTWVRDNEMFVSGLVEPSIIKKPPLFRETVFLSLDG
jgi:hypothetical protein